MRELVVTPGSECNSTSRLSVRDGKPKVFVILGRAPECLHSESSYRQRGHGIVDHERVGPFYFWPSRFTVAFRQRHTYLYIGKTHAILFSHCLDLRSDTISVPNSVSAHDQSNFRAKAIRNIPPANITSSSFL
jgi:hypothetical protein